MKLYDYPQAPNPRRVRVYLAEKGIEVPLVNIDITKGEHKAPEFMEKNAYGQVPVLELDDGTCISESIAICRYFENLHPEPSLFGASPTEAAVVEMQHRRVELGIGRSIGTSWVNGPVVARVAAGRFKQIPEAKEQADAATHAGYQFWDRYLSEHRFFAGDQYSVADITAMCMIDFAASLVGLPPAEDLEHLGRWRKEVGDRPSATA